MIIDNFQIFILYFNYQLSIYEVYNIKSRQAEEFINHEEILDTIRYAQENKHNVALIDELLEKARPKKTDHGTFCAGLLKGMSLTAAHEHAVKVSAYVCTQNGAMPELPDYMRL